MILAGLFQVDLLHQADVKIGALSSPETPYFGFLGEVGGGRSW